MRYTLLLHYPEPADGALDPAEVAAAMTAFDDYASALDRAGALVSAEMLQPIAETTTVVSVGGDLVVSTSPPSPSDDPLAGSVVIDVPDLATAIEWAERAPSAAWGRVEIRPSAIRYVDGAWRAEAPAG